MIEVLITAEELQKAVEALMDAEQRGFPFSQAVLRIEGEDSSGLKARQAHYSDISHKAHPTDSSKDFGRGERISKGHYPRRKGE